jgi:hypothetical protein
MDHSRSHEPDAQKGAPEAGQESVDRRIFERIPCRFPVRLLEVVSGTELEAKSYDISAKGLGLSSSLELMPGSAVEIWLTAEEKAQPWYTRGTVVWARKENGTGCRAGIALEKADFMGSAFVMNAINRSRFWDRYQT